MAEPYVGQIIATGFSFAPVGWQLCDGTLLQIANNEVLYTLLGTTYGGDGQTTFGVPDLRGRTIVGTGQGPGLQNYIMGQKSGTETVTLTTANMPAHSHVPQAQPAVAGATIIPGATTVFGPAGDATTNVYGPAAAVPVALNNAVVSVAAGGGQPHDNMQPFQTINYIIATQGLYPSQS